MNIVTYLLLTIIAIIIFKIAKNIDKNKDSSVLIIILCLVMILGTLIGYSQKVKANEEMTEETANEEMTEETDNFSYQKITVVNSNSNKTLFEFEGWCSVENNVDKNELELTYRIGEGQYCSNSIGLSDKTTYIITQLDSTNIDKYHYELTNHLDSETKQAEEEAEEAEEESTIDKIIFFIWLIIMCVILFSSVPR